MPAKRAHKKSRTGCRVCRTRRVKCDEVRPTCGPCRKHNVTCNYDRIAIVTSTAGRAIGPSNINLSDLDGSVTGSSPTSTPYRDTLPTPQESPPFFGTPHSRLLELQIMNHYTYMHAGHASDHHPALRLMWSYTVPQAALGSELLMDAVLSQGAQHLHVHRPQDERMRFVSHQYMGKALRNLHTSLANSSVNKGISFAASVMMAFQTFLGWKDPCSLSQSYHLPIEWLMMSQGTHSVWNSGQAEIYNSFMRPMLDALPHQECGSPPWREVGDPFQDLALLFHEETDADTKKLLLSTLDIIRKVYILMQEGQPARLTRRHLLAFPSRTKPRFIDLCRRNDPRVMLILAYYFTLMKPVEDIWWMQGRPDYEINGIMSLLPASYKSYMAWPLQVIADISRGAPRCLTPQPRGLPSPVGEANSAELQELNASIEGVATLEGSRLADVLPAVPSTAAVATG